MDEASNDPDVNVIIFTGEGRAFVAGADIAGMQPLDEKGTWNR